jgi:hypothetical protein
MCVLNDLSRFVFTNTKILLTIYEKVDKLEREREIHILNILSIKIFLIGFKL